MSELLKDELNLRLLECICNGEGVEINISYLANQLGKHRNTIKTQISALFKNDVINHPIYPFCWLYQEYPLLTVARAELPRTDEIERWFKEDEHIFAAFRVRDEEYNTLLIEYHKNIHHYGLWKKKIVREGKIPPRERRNSAHVLVFSNTDIIKHEPHSPIFVMEEKFQKKGRLEINDFNVNKLCFDIMKMLVQGQGIRTNENYLAQKLNVHRKTIERRIKALVEAGIVGIPTCRFPRFFVPPGQILVYYLMEVKHSKEKMIKAILNDNHIPMALEAGIGRYNFLLFGVFPNVEDHFLWEEYYDYRFKDTVGAMKKIYLSPNMASQINQQKVSLGIIRNKIKELRHMEN